MPIGALVATSLVLGQAPVSAPTGQKSLAAPMNVYVFPNAGQPPEQQSKDEGTAPPSSNAQFVGDFGWRDDTTFRHHQAMEAAERAR